MVRIGARSSTHARRSPGRRNAPKRKHAKRNRPQRNHPKTNHPKRDKSELKAPENSVTRRDSRERTSAPAVAQNKRIIFQVDRADLLRNRWQILNASQRINHLQTPRGEGFSEHQRELRGERRDRPATRSQCATCLNRQECRPAMQRIGTLRTTGDRILKGVKLTICIAH